MQKIASFKVNHITLERGLYVSRIDESGGAGVTTFDMRMTRPNREPVMDMPAIHTIEHIGATFFRNKAKDIVYFGPMGCRTGFYLLTFGKRTSEEILPLVKEMCEFILAFDGDIPGAEPEECGNYREQNLDTAKYYIKRYYDELCASPRLEYN